MDQWCDNCGLCCLHMRTPPHSPEEFVALPEALRMEINRWLVSPRWKVLNGRHGENTPCLWLDLSSGRCLHYEHRPEVCRDFDIGNQSCRMLRREVGLTVRGMPLPVEE